MKRILMAAVVALTAGTAQADPAEGLWKTEVDDGAYAHVRLVQCGAAICGKMERTFNSDGEYASPNIGKPLVIDMVPDGSGSYKGKVWRPANGKIYVGKMDLNGNSLALRGCVAGGLICSKQTWTRLE